MSDNDHNRIREQIEGDPNISPHFKKILLNALEKGKVLPETTTAPPIDRDNNQDLIKTLLKEADIPPRYLVEREPITIPDHFIYAQAILNNALITPDKNQILLYGKPGTGKSTLAGKSLKFAIEKIQAVCLYTTSRDICRALSSAWRANKPEPYDIYIEPEILAIDELDEFWNSEFNRFFDFIQYIICKRYDNFLKTIFITNLNKEDLKARLGDRLFSRITEINERLEIFCNWQSFRGEK